MREALKRVRELDVSMICPGHGPVLDTGIDFMFNTYEEWCTVKNPNQKKTVIIPYVSAYGYTKELSEEIARGIRDSGDIEVRSYDHGGGRSGQVLEELAFADGILFGTPSIVGEALKPIWDLTTSIFAGTHGGKLASAFGSYGWSGEGVPHIIERLKQLHMRVPDEGFRVRFRPGEVDRLDAYEYGYNFGCLLQEKENPKKAGARRGWSSAWCAAPSSTPRWRSAPSAAWAGKTLSPVDEETVSFTNNTKSFYMILGTAPPVFCGEGHPGAR